MDRTFYIDVVDDCATSDRVEVESNKAMAKNGAVVHPTYDDVFNRLTKHSQTNVSLSNCKEFQCKNAISPGKKFEHFKKRYVTFSILLLALLIGILLLVSCNILYGAQSISSSKSYPILNSDLCESGYLYRGSSWFTPLPTDGFNCDAPIQITEVYIEDLKIITGNRVVKCTSILECVSAIGFYFLANIIDCKYNFFIDYFGNVYEARGWMCPYVSGQLWVGVIADGFIPNGESEETKRILKHFNSEILSYATVCDFLSIGSLKINYLNISIIYDRR